MEQSNRLLSRITQIPGQCSDRLKMIEVGYQFGGSSSETYLAQLSAMDAKNATVFK